MNGKQHMTLPEAVQHARETARRMEAEDDAARQRDADELDELTGAADIRRLEAEVARLRAVIATALCDVDAGQWVAVRDVLRDAAEAE